MQLRTPQTQAGFSILEALISLTMFLAVLTAVLSIYTPSRRIYVRGERRVDIQQNARLAMAEIAREVRMAGYFPENFATPAPMTPPRHGVRLGTARDLAIYGDANGDGSSEVYYFCLDGTTVRRAVADPTAPAAYTCSGGQALAQGVTDLSFVYYDAAGVTIPNPIASDYKLDSQAPGAVPALGNTAQRDAVRRIAVRLTTEVDVFGRGPQEFTLSSDIFLRNQP